MPTLREIQNAMHRSLLHQDNGTMHRYIVSDHLAAGERLNIYRNTHIGSLSAVLRLAFPAVCKLVGEDFFDAAAAVFIDSHPPIGAYLYEYGAEFPAFVEGFEPAAGLRYLPDAAALEWAVHRAVHAPDIQPLDRSRLIEVAPIDQGRIAFVPHPSVGLLHLAYPAHDIWQAVLDGDDEAMAAVDLREDAKWVLVERYDGEVRVSYLSDDAAWFAARLFAGKPLQMALESGGDDAPVYLADHLAHERFIDLKLLDPKIIH